MKLNTITDKLKDVIDFNDWMAKQFKWSWICNSPEGITSYATLAEDYKKLAYYYLGVGPDDISQKMVINIYKKRIVGMSVFNSYFASYFAMRKSNMQILYLVHNQALARHFCSLVGSLYNKEIKSINVSNSIIYFKNGSEIHFKAKCNIRNTACGRHLDLLIVDECELNEEEMNAILPCTVFGKTIFISELTDDLIKKIEPTKINKGIYVC